MGRDVTARMHRAPEALSVELGKTNPIARGAELRAIILRMTDRPDLDPLVSRARTLAATGSRRLLGICGAPGAGKSTLAEQLVVALGDRAVLVGMDGFHLSQRELRRLGREQRKGAPDTFDAAGYVDLIHRLRRNGPGEVDAETVYAPEFRREIEEPIAGAVPVAPEVPLVVTEGNYLLLPDHPWNALRGLLDEVWFLAPDESVRIARLVERHRRYGRSDADAHDRAYGNDQRNALRIQATADRADLVLRGA
jgi:pantothenate kinase